MKIEQFQLLYDLGKIKWTAHGLERMQERNIRRQDVKCCIMSGEIIEEYPDDYPHPSSLIFGYNVDNKVLHVVAGLTADYIYVITAYYPSTAKFKKDLKTRR